MQYVITRLLFNYTFKQNYNFLVCQSKNANDFLVGDFSYFLCKYSFALTNLLLKILSPVVIYFTILYIA